jgi:hypothetical protein
MDQNELLRFTLNVLEQLKIPYALVGSYGSSVFGVPRFTRDIDILVELSETTISAFCAAFPTSDFYFSEAAVRDAVRGRFQFNMLHPASGNKIDFILPRNDAWGRSQLGRSKRLQLQPGLVGSVASPEDVIIGKLWYFAEGGSDRHLADVAGILRVTGDKVNRNEIECLATELGYLEIWRQVVTMVDAPDQPPGPGVP